MQKPDGLRIDSAGDGKPDPGRAERLMHPDEKEI